MGEILVLKTQSENREIPIYDTAPSKPYLGIKGKGYIPLLEGMSGNGIYIKNGSAKYALQELVLEPVVFSSDSNFTLSVATPMWNGTMQYSTNNGNTWSDWNGSQLSGTANQPILLRGMNNRHITGRNSSYKWTFTGKYITGNLENLLDCKIVAMGQHPNMQEYCFGYMFYNCTSLVTAPSLLATTLIDCCYSNMFYGCTSLVNPPTLPATTMAEGCYEYMFYGCTSLTTTPSLPATTLDAGCYCDMFAGCTSLRLTSDLSATLAPPSCYYEMFKGCTSLTYTPGIYATSYNNGSCYAMFEGCTALTNGMLSPATSLGPNCFDSMFRNCTSLKNAPSLPATTLADYCYYRMFEGCTSLTGMPALPATTLTISCYNNMFSGCTSLSTLNSLPATTLATLCYSGMFSGCTSLLVAPTLSATTLQPGCYSYMFKNCTLLAMAPSLPATIMQSDCYRSMFEWCTILRTAPSLSSTSLAYGCYRDMFKNCKELINVSSLPATTLSDECYWGMFYGCEKLETAPRLPATTLRDHCYCQMFTNCKALVTPPEILATTLLTGSCCSAMFQGCTSLTTAPQLRATTMQPYCYDSMFSGCTSLITPPELPATILDNYCYQFMFSGCTSLTTLPFLSATTLQRYCYYRMFYGCTSIKLSTSYTSVYKYDFRIPDSGTGATASLALTEMFSGTGGTFTGTPTINTTYYTDHGVDAYLTFSSDTNFQLYTYAGKTWDGTLEYSTGGAWTTWNGSTTLNGTASQPIYLRGTGNTIITNGASNNDRWVFTGKYITGNIETLLDYKKVAKGQHPTMGNNCFAYMFRNCTSLITPPDLLATTLALYCYNYMFNGCSSLTTAPILPATTLSDYCYYGMFSNCTSLINPPELPATTLAIYCYSYMFNGCTSLTTLPELPATTLTSSCYYYMFYGCTSIKLSSSMDGANGYIYPYRIPSSDTGTTASNALSYMFTYTGGTYAGTPTINTTYYTDHGDTLPYLIFISDSSFQLYPYNNTKTWDGTLEYSGNGSTWYTWNGALLSGSASQPILIRGIGNTRITGSSVNGNRWIFTGKQILGNIETLLDYQTVQNGGHPTMYPYCFANMFNSCTSLTTAPELSATTLQQYCYYQMFYGCTSLIIPPELPATTLVSYCYYGMFSNTGICLSSTQTGNYENLYMIPPSGNGTTASNALTNMFSNTGGTFTGTPTVNTAYYYATSAPLQAYLEFSSDSSFTLQAASKKWNGAIQYSTNNGSSWTNWNGSQLSGTAYQSICLRGIDNTVITGGNYPWTFTGKYIVGNIETLLDYQTVQNGGHPTMAASCFRQMFSNCTTLITPPELPATTLSQYCYYQMFYQCTALTTLPNLPATTLPNYCYQGMFRYCSNLRLSTSQKGSYQYAYRIPTSGNGTVGTSSLNNMFSNTGGSFTGAPTINTTYYTYYEPV